MPTRPPYLRIVRFLARFGVTLGIGLLRLTFMITPALYAYLLLWAARVRFHPP